MCKRSASRTEGRKEGGKERKTWPDSASSATQREVRIRRGELRAPSCERRAASDSDVSDAKTPRKKPTSKRRKRRAGARDSAWPLGKVMRVGEKFTRQSLLKILAVAKPRSAEVNG